MCQPERFLQAGLAGDQAMMLQQRGFAVLQRYRDMLRQLAGAEGGIGRAGDRIPMRPRRSYSGWPGWAG